MNFQEVKLRIRGTFNTQRALCQKYKINQQYLSDYLHNSNNLSIRSENRIKEILSDELDIPFDDLPTIERAKVGA